MHKCFSMKHLLIAAMLCGLMNVDLIYTSAASLAVHDGGIEQASLLLMEEGEIYQYVLP